LEIHRSFSLQVSSFPEQLASPYQERTTTQIGNIGFEVVWIRAMSDQLELPKSDIVEADERFAAASPIIPISKEPAPAGTQRLPLIEDDEDLVPLLRQASNDELDPLVKCIIEKGGVTAQLGRTQRYRLYSASGDHRKYADHIAAEIQRFGANTVRTAAVREGRGIKYRKILAHMAKRCGVKARRWDETVAIEERVLLAVLSKSYEGMTEEQRQELLATLKINRLPGVGGPDIAGALQVAFAADAGFVKGLALFAGPIGWALDPTWGGSMVAGPAHRVTLPCVVQVALIRQSLVHRQRRVERL
jgi:uncharacterized protein YaaW (UPF0174 family)